MNIDESREQPYEGSPLQASDRLRARIAALEADLAFQGAVTAALLPYQDRAVKAEAALREVLKDAPYIMGRRCDAIRALLTQSETTGEHEPICSCGLTIAQKAQCHCGGWQSSDAPEHPNANS